MTGTPASAMARRASTFEPMTSIASAGGPIQTIPASSQARASVGVLREEAVAGVERLGAGPERRLDDPLDVRVALGRRTGADQEGLVGAPDVERVPVGLRVHGHAADPELPERAEDAHGDLAAVGDEHLGERRSLGDIRPYSVSAWASQTS